MLKEVGVGIKELTSFVLSLALWPVTMTRESLTRHGAEEIGQEQLMRGLFSVLLGIVCVTIAGLLATVAPPPEDKEILWPLLAIAYLLAFMASMFAVGTPTQTVPNQEE